MVVHTSPEIRKRARNIGRARYAGPWRIQRNNSLHGLERWVGGRFANDQKLEPRHDAERGTSGLTHGTGARLTPLGPTPPV
jgi:hypothetical protein